MALTDSRLTDYTHASYIPIIDGVAINWNETTYVSHITNLTEYERCVQETMDMTGLFPQSHMKKILIADTEHLTTLLSILNVHHRHARSLNVLGSVLKIIAGTPDHDDLQLTRMTEHDLIQSNNRQIKINTAVQDRINALTNTVNEILKVKKKEEVDTAHLYETLLARNRMLTLELQNVMIAVTLAKAKIVNPAIIDNNDLNTILNENLTDVSVAQLLSVASIKVLASSQIIHFIINFPKPKYVCKKVTILPVAHAGISLQIPEDTVADCQGIIRPLKSCNGSPAAMFCKEDNNSTCATELHAGVIAHCNTQPSHLTPVAIVDEGLIIINDSPSVVSLDGEPEQQLNGTHLLAFQHTAMINGTSYLNFNGLSKKHPDLAAASNIKVARHQTVLSLPYLHKLNEENLQRIDELQTDLVIGPILAGSLGAILCASLFGVSWWLRRRRQKRFADAVNQVLRDLGVTEDGQVLKEGVVNSR